MLFPIRRVTHPLHAVILQPSLPIYNNPHIISTQFFSTPYHSSHLTHHLKIIPSKSPSKALPIATIATPQTKQKSNLPPSPTNFPPALTQGKKQLPAKSPPPSPLISLTPPPLPPLKPSIPRSPPPALKTKNNRTRRPPPGPSPSQLDVPIRSFGGAGYGEDVVIF